MNFPVVVKVGGSLFDWPGFSEKLASYLDRRRGDRLVLVVGGGRFADALRHYDSALALGEPASHALALRVLDVTARLVVAIVPGLEVVEDLEAIPDAWSRGKVPVLAPRRFLDGDDRSPDPLPHAWTTTTDSIAARLTVRLGAGELVLLKSTPLPRLCDRSDAARLGLVDAEFPRTSAEIPLVIFQDLRGSEPGVRLR